MSPRLKQCAEARELIDEAWLKECGFKYHQFDRQPGKQWLLWLGDALMDTSVAIGERKMFSSYEDLGIELAWDNSGRKWFCWLRSDSCHRYHRFLHIRFLVYREELIALIEALTGREFKPENAWYGALRTENDAAKLRAEYDRLDRRIHREQHPWSSEEADDDRGRPLQQHVSASVDGGKAK